MSKITESAKGEMCQVRVPGVCSHRDDTTVFAHLNGGGLAMKHSDPFGAYACFDCHAWLDGGYARQGATREERDCIHMQGMVRTQYKLLEKGLIIIT